MHTAIKRGKTFCFEHKHMGMRESALWNLCSRLSHKSNPAETPVLYFDGDTFAAMFHGESRSTLYRTMNKLLASGWAVLLEPRKRTGGRFAASKFRLLSHAEWTAKHGESQCSPVSRAELVSASTSSKTGGSPVPEQASTSSKTGGSPVPRVEHKLISTKLIKSNPIEQQLHKANPNTLSSPNEGDRRGRQEVAIACVPRPATVEPFELLTKPAPPPRLTTDGWKTDEYRTLCAPSPDENTLTDKIYACTNTVERFELEEEKKRMEQSRLTSRKAEEVRLREAYDAAQRALAPIPRPSVPALSADVLRKAELRAAQEQRAAQWALEHDGEPLIDWEAA
jgi:hypothetical protein